MTVVYKCFVLLVIPFNVIHSFLVSFITSCHSLLLLRHCHQRVGEGGRPGPEKDDERCG